MKNTNQIDKWMAILGLFSFPRSAWECRPGRSRVREPASTTQSVEDGIPTGTVGTSLEIDKWMYILILSLSLIAVQGCHNSPTSAAAQPNVNDNAEPSCCKTETPAKNRLPIRNRRKSKSWQAN